MRPGFEAEDDKDAGLGVVMLEGGARGAGARRRRSVALHVAAVDVAEEVTFAVVAHAVAEDEVVHPAADVQRIDLDVSVMGEGGGDIRCGRVEQQRAALEAAGVVGREAERLRHGAEDGGRKTEDGGLRTED